MQPQGRSGHRSTESRLLRNVASDSIRGRDRESAALRSLLTRARAGKSGAVIVSGTAGVGKTTLLNRLADEHTDTVRIERMTAAESEMELTYAGLHLLCGHMMDVAEGLPAPQREALEGAFGMRDAATPNPFLVGLAVLGLLTRVAADGGMLCIIDDAQWLDEVSARAVAFVCRRLSSEGIAIVLAMREVDEHFADLPQLVVEGLGDDDARELLRAALPVAIDDRVRDQLIEESHGNPLALQELPRTLSPVELAGGFALAESVPVERRIEQSVVAQLEALPDSTRMLLLLAAADPTGDTGLLWRASSLLGLGASDYDLATQAGMLVVGARMGFRHPLLRSAVYRAASPEHRRQAHAALAEATPLDRDPDRRAWHRANATVRPDEDVAAELEQLAERARARGGVAAAAAFLARAAELSPQPQRRAERMISAAAAKHDAGAPDTALRLLDSIRDLALTAAQRARIGRLRARAGYALRRDRSAPRQLLAAAQRLEPFDSALARDTYMEALSAALYAGRLGEPGALETVAQAILDATANDQSEQARDLILRGQALMFVEGQEAALPTVRRALLAFEENPPDALDLHWMWFGGRAAQDLWDADGLRSLAARQVELARDGGVVTVLPMALSLLMVARTFDGDLDEAEAICDEIDAILYITGHPLPKYGRTFVAAYRGHIDEVERRAKQLRLEAHKIGEGYALTVANMAEALVYNGAGRYAEALESARREMPYAGELGHAMRTLVELVEAASRVGEQALAEEAAESLAKFIRPVGESDWALAMLALVQAQVSEGDAAEALYREAIERFGRVRVPMLVARSQLLYGEMLRRRGRQRDAIEQLRLAHTGLLNCGMNGFAERARGELQAAGEKVQPITLNAAVRLTPQELSVAKLARDGLTNRNIGARLFISARTAEYHLRKVFVKLGISSRSELSGALAEFD